MVYVGYKVYAFSFVILYTVPKLFHLKVQHLTTFPLPVTCIPMPYQYDPAHTENVQNALELFLVKVIYSHTLVVMLSPKLFPIVFQLVHSFYEQLQTRPASTMQTLWYQHWYYRHQAFVWKVLAIAHAHLTDTVLWTDFLAHGILELLMSQYN